MKSLSHLEAKQRSDKWIVYDGDDYNFADARQLTQGKRSNLFESTVNFVKATMGIGLLDIHHAFMKGGLAVSTALNVIIGLIFIYTTFILVNCAHKLCSRLHKPAMTYSDLAEASFAISKYSWMRNHCRTFRYLVDILLCSNQFGMCICQHIFVAKMFKQLVENNQSGDIGGVNGSPDLRFYIICVFFMIYAICLITNLKYLAPLSFIADMMIAFAVLTTAYYAFETQAPLPQRQTPKTFHDFAEFIGFSQFDLQGICVCLSIENNMKRPMDIKTVLLIGYTIVIFTTTFVGFLGFWTYGDNSVVIIIQNFPLNRYTVYLKCFTAVMILLTYSLNFYTPFQICWGYLGTQYREEHIRMWVTIYRTIFFILLTIMAICFPKIDLMMEFIGSFCLPALAFVFPALIQFSIQADDPDFDIDSWSTVRFAVIIIIGLLLWLSGTFILGRLLFRF